MKIRLLLGDQLNSTHPWFDVVDDEVLYVQMEMRQETDYAPHHIQKLIAFFGAMRNFHQELVQNGHHVLYMTLDAPDNRQDLTQNLQEVIRKHPTVSFSYQSPDEYRLAEQLKNFCKQLTIPTEEVDTHHFMASQEELHDYFTGKKQYVLEFFYRKMRKKFDLLMAGVQPEGGQWNFDKHNRKKWKGTPEIPNVYSPGKTGLKHLHQLFQEQGVKSIGYFDPETFIYPLSRAECLEQLDYFCNHLLVHFGDYQDAMHTEELNLFHSRLSFGLNTKMISPLEVVGTVIEYYREHTADIDLSQVEGFVRQIVGWREYMRGIYWTQMPHYKRKML